MYQTFKAEYSSFSKLADETSMDVDTLTSLLAYLLDNVQTLNTHGVETP